MELVLRLDGTTIHRPLLRHTAVRHQDTMGIHHFQSLQMLADQWPNHVRLQDPQSAPLQTSVIIRLRIQIIAPRHKFILWHKIRQRLVHLEQKINQKMRHMQLRQLLHPRLKLRQKDRHLRNIPLIAIPNEPFVFLSGDEHGKFSECN